MKPRPPLDRLDAWRVRMPLVQPYKLAFGPLSHYDSVFIRVQRRDGGLGWGESTPLPGYTDENIEGNWRGVAQILQALEAQPGLDVETLLLPFDAAQPFLASALRSAFEMAAGCPLLSLKAPSRVPILGLLQSEDPRGLDAAVEALLAAGYRTLKLKVGFEPAADAAFVAAAQRAVAGRAMLRLDANQGYSGAQAAAFLAALSPDGIELFEQPCAADDWVAHLALVPAARERGIALMLDESIYGLADIERVAELTAARFVKVKLMKFGGLARLDAALARTAALGLTPVLGNGVAHELGCWMEACIATRRIRNAGEMNGFLKPVARLFTRPLQQRNGAIELDTLAPEIDLDALHFHSLAHAGLSL